jgi:hypothetical protein
MRFIALIYLIMQVVQAMDTHVTKLAYNVRVVPPPVPLIPTNIAIKISCNNDIGKIAFINLKIFPKLADITKI